MQTFHELVSSRRVWIEEILIPWCRTASRKDLLLAEHEWQDIAGRPSPEMTLWKWAWSRFPALTHAGLQTLNETNSVTLKCVDGRVAEGYPDASRSISGLLFVIDVAGQTVGPFEIDEIISVEVTL